MLARTAPHWLVLILLTMVLVAGCPDGSGTVSIAGIPLVTAVTPQGAVAQPNQVVQFSALATNNPTRWLWTFPAGATPRSSTSATPQVQFALAGEFECSVRAINDRGGSRGQSFTVRITNDLRAPQILAIAPVDAAGEMGGTLTFSALATYSPSAWNWTFGGGVTPLTSTDAAPRVSLDTIGSYTGTVTASNAAGTSQTLNFSYRIDPGPQPQILAVEPLDPAGIEGSLVRFRAISNGGGDLFTWQLNNGAAPAFGKSLFPITTTNSVLPTRLRYAGTYNGTVQFQRDDKTSEAFSFSYTVGQAVNIPAILSVDHEPLTFTAGQPVRFSATIANPAAEWSWAFLTGGKAITSNSVAPWVVFPEAGNYLGAVTALNSRGFSEKQFTYTVEKPQG